MKRWIAWFSFVSFLYSCHTWQDKDLYIQEVFINTKNDPYLILKNLGHSDIDERGIDLVVIWDESHQVTIDLDSIDPHFRNEGDSSIIPLPFLPGLIPHHITARVDSKNVLAESDEDHNTYSRTIFTPVLASTKSVFRYPSSAKSFDLKSYQSFINTSPIASIASWDNGSRSVSLQYWPVAWKDQLMDHIHKIYTQDTIIYPDTLTTGFSPSEAFDIYLSYLAHSIYIEHDHLLPWSVVDFELSDIKDLWDSHQYFQYDSINKNYQYNYINGGAVRVFHPLATYLFGRSMQSNHFSNSAAESMTSILEWSRAYLHHTERSGQIYFQSIPQTWYPAKGNVHAVYSCWATGGLLLDYCRSFNLPIHKRSMELFNGLHTQLSFPSLHSYITHADDLYDPLFYPADHPISIQSMMMNQDEYNAFNDRRAFCIGDTCHSMGTQHTYDRRKDLLQRAVAQHSSFLIMQYDESNTIYRSYLRGDEFNNLLKPVLNIKEQDDLTHVLIQDKTNHKMIKDLYLRYLECKNNRR